jgi:hypothetical protein
MVKTMLQAYWRGFDEAVQGFDITLNPYKETGKRWVQYERGWLAGKASARGKMA